MSGHKDGSKEVELSIRRLFTYAAWADKFDGTISGVPVRGVGLTMREAIGNIIAFCPPNKPLLSLISCIAPAIAMGNRITTISPFIASMTATDFYQILETSDIPPGVVNILTGSHLELASHAASHMDVDSVWSFSEEDITKIHAVIYVARQTQKQIVIGQKGEVLKRIGTKARIDLAKN